jgi:hypothetical protein
MKVGDYIRVKERAEFERVPAKHLIKPLFLMSTYERPGLLSKTVESFLERENLTPRAAINVFDDGSKSKDKATELDYVEQLGVTLHRWGHKGILGMWMEALSFARRQSGYDCVVLMEDDISFSGVWLDVLASLMSENLGMASCFRFHTDVVQSEVVNRIEVFRVKWCSFQATLMPMSLVQQSEIFKRAALKSERSHTGMDVGLSEVVTEMGRPMYVTARSYVIHTGYKDSIARRHGYRCLPVRGVNLVYELEKLNEGRRAREDSKVSSL